MERTHSHQYLAPAIALLLLTISNIYAQQLPEVDWQKKAVADFPQIAVAGSPENKKFLAKYKELKDGNSPLLYDPQWPYLIAKLVCVNVIPGLSAVQYGVPESNPTATPTPTPTDTWPSNGVFDSSNATLLSHSKFKGQTVTISGTVTKTEVPPLDQSQFYVYLDNGTVCEFQTDTFLTGSAEGLGGQIAADGRDTNIQMKMKFEEDNIFVVSVKHHDVRYWNGSHHEKISVPKEHSLGQIFKKGDKVYLKGVDRGTNANGLRRGILISNCQLIENH